jgi:hypothetical protein
MLLTHYWSIFLGAVLGAWLLWRAVRNQDRPTAVLGLAGMAGGALLFLPWLPSFLHQAAHTGAPWAPDVDLGAIASLPVEWFGGEGPAGRSLALLAWPLMLLGVLTSSYAASAAGVTRRERAGTDVGRIIGGVVLATLLLAVFASWATGGAAVGRYTSVVAPVAFFLVVLGIAALPPRAGLQALGVLLVVGLLAGVTIVRSDKTQTADVAALLEARARPGDVVVYCPDQLAPGVVRNLDAPGLVALTRPAQREPRLIDWTDYVDRLEREPIAPIVDRAATASAAGSSVWLVIAPFGYRTHEQDCPDVRTELTNRLGPPERTLEYGEKVFEKAELLRFGGRR